MSGLEHALATVEDDATGRCRYVCACGARGRWVHDVGTSFTADTWAREAHAIHASQAKAIDDGARPEDWGAGDAGASV